MLVELRKCDIIWIRNNNEGGRGSRRTFGSERDAGLSPCRCLSNREVPLGTFLYSKDINSYKNIENVLTKNEKTVYNNFKSKRLLNVAVDL
jgi:hypothetical protein